MTKNNTVKFFNEVQIMRVLKILIHHNRMPSQGRDHESGKKYTHVSVNILFVDYYP